MSDLGDRLGAYIDAAAPTISMEEIQGSATTTPEGERRGVRWRAVLAVAAAAALLIGVAVAFRSARVDEVTAGPGTTAPAGEDLSWLTPLGTEVPAPAVPAGWKVLDFQDMRFAVPADWATPVSASCARQDAPGVVLTSNGRAETACGPGPTLPPSKLVFEPATSPATEGARRVTLGTLTGELVADPACSSCAPQYRLDNGYHVVAAGYGVRALSTLTDSGRQRALQSGPVADATTWQSVTFGRVTFDVPPRWSTLDLAASFTQTTGPGGSVLQVSGHANPGICGPALFPVNGNATAFVGLAPMTPSCPAGVDKALEPTDGAWIRALDNADPNTTTVSRGRLHGLDVEIRSLDATRDRSAAPLELDVHVGAATQRLTIGVGLDASVARAIVRSIRPAGANRDPVPTVAPPASTSPAPPGATSGTEADRDARFCVALVAYVHDFSEAAPAPGSPGPTIDRTQRIQEARNRLHEIAELAPPEDAPYWSALADRPDSAPTAADDPALFNSIDESVAWRCRSGTRSQPTPTTADLAAFCAAARSYYGAAATNLGDSAGTAVTAPSRDLAAHAHAAADTAPADVAPDWRLLASLEEDAASTAGKESVRQRLNVAFVQRCP